MYHLAKLTLEDVKQLEHYIGNTIVEPIRKGRVPRRLSLAVDSTEVLSGIKEFTGVVVTLYTFRRIIRSKLEAIQDDSP
ncbi:MAG: hypothetical protein ABGF52_11685 [Candidatus Asgardarchaeum sp.]